MNLVSRSLSDKEPVLKIAHVILLNISGSASGAIGFGADITYRSAPNYAAIGIIIVLL